MARQRWATRPNNLCRTVAQLRPHKELLWLIVAHIATSVYPPPSPAPPLSPISWPQHASERRRGHDDAPDDSGPFTGSPHLRRAWLARIPLPYADPGRVLLSPAVVRRHRQASAHQTWP